MVIVTDLIEGKNLPRWLFLLVLEGCAINVSLRVLSHGTSGPEVGSVVIPVDESAWELSHGYCIVTHCQSAVHPLPRENWMNKTSSDVRITLIRN